ncbi:MAG: FtsW/RodA/SpoVE family cell cycle protein [Akkermansiaceae bacterium]|nr:FtsW/RodA/SpoVE family cell cycle protein [Akkermansiaceae bacterium]MDP4720510.1 FtsW/RodA/SpoVE family cell cycle protein [Akkermansiaceae bacterium]MDP4896356.1 FtsW/RodA/SpoVE family cell cycle protein [Akkermansiaceae bacterium]MDP4995671.1 FtsW/RodA/SpoVE family cell cycle protein [Akkermansiaceae bacterium]
MYGLLIFGVFMIESAARHLPMSAENLAEFGSAGTYFAWMQKNWIVIGSVAYFAAALIDYRWIRWLGIPLYVVSLGLMVMAMQADDDVHRLTIGGLSFQPAQLGVTSGIVMIAWLMQDLPKLHRWLGDPFVRIGVIGVVSAIPFLLVMKMGDMGSALVWIPVVIVALLVAGIPYRFLTFIASVSAMILPILYFVILPLVSERGPDRIDLWLRMLDGQEVDIQGDGYAPHNVSMAVGKAGWKGVGWKATAEKGSLHDKKFIPHLTAHNDFIFAVIAEELGFRGALLLIGGFALLLIQGLFIGFYSRDVAGRLIVCMVVALFFAHIYENIGMCVLLMPITGIPLPLISYSGTFVVICMFLLGLVQSVWVHRHRNRPEEA